MSERNEDQPAKNERIITPRTYRKRKLKLNFIQVWSEYEEVVTRENARDGICLEAYHCEVFQFGVILVSFDQFCNYQLEVMIQPGRYRDVILRAQAIWRENLPKYREQVAEIERVS